MWLSVYLFSPSYFILNKRTGFLIIKENAPPGTYEFQVRVSDGVWPDAVSTVIVHVRELRDEAIYNSGSLRLAGLYRHTHPYICLYSRMVSCVTCNILLLRLCTAAMLSVFVVRWVSCPRTCLLHSYSSCYVLVHWFCVIMWMTFHI